jgi:hypothetical protein
MKAPMHPSSTYRRMAEDCARLAGIAPSARGKESFLAASQHWMRLARLAEQRHDEKPRFLPLHSLREASDAARPTVA